MLWWRQLSIPFSAPGPHLYQWGDPELQDRRASSGKKSGRQVKKADMISVQAPHLRLHFMMRNLSASGREKPNLQNETERLVPFDTLSNRKLRLEAPEGTMKIEYPRRKRTTRDRSTGERKSLSTNPDKVNHGGI